MRRRTLHLSCFVACLGLVVAGHAQQGHPLTGTWSGDWGASATKRNQITVVMNWDGRSVTGLINPGPGSIPLMSVFLDPANWTVRIEADAKDESGRPVHISADGRLEDIGSYHRSIRGNWKQGAVSGDFRLTRE